LPDLKRNDPGLSIIPVPGEGTCVTETDSSPYNASETFVLMHILRSLWEGGLWDEDVGDPSLHVGILCFYSEAEAFTRFCLQDMCAANSKLGAA
jgi:hypothetical protein